MSGFTPLGPYLQGNQVVFSLCLFCVIDVRCADTCRCVAVAYGVQYGTVMFRFAAQGLSDVPSGLGMQWATASRFA